MARKQSDNSFSEEEAARRLAPILHGAFAGPPTPLKSIPTRHGETRARLVRRIFRSVLIGHHRTRTPPGRGCPVPIPSDRSSIGRY